MTSEWPGDGVQTREIAVGSIGLPGREDHPRCLICGADCTDARIEWYAFAPTYILVTTCLKHALTLLARLEEP